MAFRFTLKTMLRLRESLERAELQLLQAIAAHVVRVRAEIESLDARAEEARRQLLRDASGGISGAELRFGALREAAWQELRSGLQEKLAELEKLRRAQQMRYKEARQRREILSNLRERQYEAYRLEQSRREQKLVDELFVIRRGSSAAK